MAKAMTEAGLYIKLTGNGSLCVTEESCYKHLEKRRQEKVLAAYLHL